jgi:hypothetical protein
MNALSTISITVIDAVSDANANGRARRTGTQNRDDREGVAERERQRDRDSDGRDGPPVCGGGDDQPEDFSDGAAGEAVDGR